MKRLQEKWNSSQGASILIALLLLLVCMMVASSVLMAAASNAGKLRSSREEHQKYLTLSSALRLVCGEIEGSSYVGKYSHSTDEVTKTVLVQKKDENGNLIVDENGDPVMTEEQEHDYYRYTYKQMEGDYTCGLNDLTNQVLPLRDQLDFLFGKKLNSGAGVVQYPADQYVFVKRSLNYVFPIRFTLTVAPDDDVFEPVSIDFNLREDGIITLTASLPQDSTGYVYAMEAELAPDTPLDNVFVLTSTGSTNQTAPVHWKLNWIAKKGA